MGKRRRGGDGGDTRPKSSDVVHTDPSYEWEDTDAFSSLEDGMGAFVPEWDADETTDLGRTQMRLADSEQVTRLHGRAFDELRRQHTPQNPQPRVEVQAEPREGPAAWVAGLGVLGALVMVMVALIAAMLLLTWISLRGGPRSAQVVVGAPPASEEVAPAEPSPSLAPAPATPVAADPSDPVDGEPGTLDPAPGEPDEPVEEPAPTPRPPAVGGGGFEARFPARFDFNRWTPKDVDQTALDVLVADMKARCSGVIVLTGHTDGVGPDGVNERFAIARASSARDVISEAGGIPKPTMVLASAIDDPTSGEEGRRVEISCP